MIYSCNTPWYIIIIINIIIIITIIIVIKLLLLLENLHVPSWIWSWSPNILDKHDIHRQGNHTLYLETYSVVDFRPN